MCTYLYVYTYVMYVIPTFIQYQSTMVRNMMNEKSTSTIKNKMKKKNV